MALRVEGIGVFAGQFKKRDLADIVLKQVERKGLIVDSNATYQISNIKSSSTL